MNASRTWAVAVTGKNCCNAFAIFVLPKNYFTARYLIFTLPALITTPKQRFLLQGAGKISHEIAVEKATGEYKKYQQKTLSEAEKNYLESLKMLEQTAKKNK